MSSSYELIVQSSSLDIPTFSILEKFPMRFELRAQR